VGGAVVPLVTGTAADDWGLKAALTVPAVCYCGILAFGWFARRPLLAGAPPESNAAAGAPH
jgi:FHS family L-fucose permease-like MFS transporter